jgi:hypothetical protein
MPRRSGSARGDARKGVPYRDRAISHFLHRPFAAAELPLPVFCVQQKALEIAETIEDQTRDLAGESQAAFFVRGALLPPLAHG